MASCKAAEPVCSTATGVSMFTNRLRCLPLLLLLLASLSISITARADQKKAMHKKAAMPVQPQPAPQPAPPPPPLTLAQMPAVAPQVTFQNGQLTIIAPNSTLGDILRAVHARTGAEVE